jgi:hypothetical protein
MSFGWFGDAGLTVPLTRADFVRGAPAAVDRVVYFGSTATGKKLQRASSPGVAALEVVVQDADTGAGVQASHVRLALSAGGLAAATPGAALPIGATVLSGAANAVPVFVRLDAPLTTAGNYDDVSLAVNGSLETDV